MKILDGSFDFIEETGEITAGMYEGENEEEMTSLRYIRANINDGLEGDTFRMLLERVYQNSTGCTINKDFKMK